MLFNIFRTVIGSDGSVSREFRFRSQSTSRTESETSPKIDPIQRQQSEPVTVNNTESNEANEDSIHAPIDPLPPTVEVTVEDIPILLNQMQCELTWAGANTATSTYGLLFLRVPVSSAWARVWHSYAKNLISMKSEDSLFANSYCIKKTSVKVLQ